MRKLSKGFYVGGYVGGLASVFVLIIAGALLIAADDFSM